MNRTDDHLLNELEAMATSDEQLMASPHTYVRVMAVWDERAAPKPRHLLRWWNYAGLGALSAAIVLLAIALRPASQSPQAPLAVVETVDGSLRGTVAQRDEVMRSGTQLRLGSVVRTGVSSHTQLALADGSRVEIRSQSRLSLDRSPDGIRLLLDQGGIIVHAAKQRTGHLYVQTKDVAVEVVGTVFLVNAERRGSRVAVLEGEVHVTRGTVAKTLRPGEQVSTSAALEALPVQEELAWSRRHQALQNLLQAASQRAQTVGQSGAPVQPFEVLGGNPRFDVESVRPCADDVAGNRGGPIRLTPGRMVATCQTVMGFINAAFRLFAEGRSNPYSNVQVVGGPSWIHSERYTIAATAPDYASPALMQGPMLQALLEDRFRLKVHREVRGIPIYSLTIAKGGHTLPPYKEGSCTPVDPPTTFPPPPRPAGWVPCAARVRRVGPHVRVEWHRATLQELVWILSLNVDRPVLDRTGIIGLFDGTLEFTPDESNPRVPPGSSDEAPTAPSLFTAVQEQLGLKLEKMNGPGEFVVIDDIQRPSEN
jgi:uncharacterized protein (TIGR03435 family)